MREVEQTLSKREDTSYTKDTVPKIRQLLDTLNGLSSRYGRNPNVGDYASSLDVIGSTWCHYNLPIREWYAFTIVIVGLYGILTTP